MFHFVFVDRANSIYIYIA